MSSARATGTDNWYVEASRAKQVCDEAVTAHCCITAKKELKINDLTESPKQNLLSNKIVFTFFKKQL